MIYPDFQKQSSSLFENIYTGNFKDITVNKLDAGWLFMNFMAYRGSHNIAYFSNGGIQIKNDVTLSSPYQNKHFIDYVTTEPKYAEKIKEIFSATPYLTGVSKIRQVYNGLSANDIGRVALFLPIESQASLRFTENFYRFLTNQPPLSPKETVKANVIDNCVEAKLSHFEIIKPDQQYEELIRVARIEDNVGGTRKNLKTEETEILKKLNTDIIKCTYTDSAKTYTRYFWYKTSPSALADIAKQYSFANHYHLLFIGPAVNTAPKTLKQAAKIFSRQ